MKSAKFVLGCVVAAAIGIAASLRVAPARDSDDGAASGHARTAVAPSPAPRVVPIGDAVLPGTLSAHSRAGTVVEVPGPFDDRFGLASITLAKGTVPGVLTVTGDVSDLIDLQVLAGLYDTRGPCLGQGSTRSTVRAHIRTRSCTSRCPPRPASPAASRRHR